MRLSGQDHAGGSRSRALDQARGVAVLAMIVYHFAWDLSHFGLIEARVGAEPGWRLFAQTIAASFLAISGASLALAAERGLSLRAFQRRLAIIAGAAALVTVATYFVFPQSYIFFGILHCIAAASLLALAFLRLPALAGIVAGAAMLALPAVFEAEVFDAWPLLWLGLGTVTPLSNDFVPLFPWAGFCLLGLAVGRLAAARVKVARSLPLPWLDWLGQKSLPIYLIHQPVLFGGLMLAVSLGLGEGRRETSGFVRSCAIECQASGGQPSVCLAACRCTAERLKPLPVWRRIVAESMSAEDESQAQATGRACFSEALDARSGPAKP